MDSVHSDLNEIVCSFKRLKYDRDFEGEFCDNAVKFLKENNYFVSLRNLSVVKQFFVRIFSVLQISGENRISVLLTGSKQCGKTSLMRLTIDYLNSLDLKACACYFECHGDRLRNVMPKDLLFRQAVKLGYFTESDSFESIAELLEGFKINSVFPFVFYDEAESIWALREDEFRHSCQLVDELHAIGSSGRGFGCLSGSSWKLVPLAYRDESILTAKTYPSLSSYHSLNHQKYGKLSLYPLTDPVDTCDFLQLEINETNTNYCSDLIVKTGGRFEYLKKPERANFNVFVYPNSGIEWRIWTEFLIRNETLFQSINHDEQGGNERHKLLDIEPIARNTLMNLIEEFRCQDLVVDDLVDKDLIVPVIDNPHKFLPGCIGCVYQLWEYDRSFDLSLDLVRALRYPVGRPHSELLEWYCNTNTIHPEMEYLAINAPGELLRRERKVYLFSELDINTIQIWAGTNKRFKPYLDRGVDMLQFRLNRTRGRWPRITIYIDCIQMKLSDKSSIDGNIAINIEFSMRTAQIKYVAEAQKLIKTFSRVTVETGDRILVTTWNITSPAEATFRNKAVTVVKGMDIVWHESIRNFCRREAISWINHPHK